MFVAAFTLILANEHAECATLQLQPNMFGANPGVIHFMRLLRKNTRIHTGLVSRSIVGDRKHRVIKFAHLAQSFRRRSLVVVMMAAS